jgi:hypothetical protein
MVGSNTDGSVYSFYLVLRRDREIAFGYSIQQSVNCLLFKEKHLLGSGQGRLLKGSIVQRASHTYTHCSE